MEVILDRVSERMGGLLLLNFPAVLEKGVGRRSREAKALTRKWTTSVWPFRSDSIPHSFLDVDSNRSSSFVVRSMNAPD